jgi:hypothetical protein
LHQIQQWFDSIKILITDFFGLICWLKHIESFQHICFLVLLHFLLSILITWISVQFVPKPLVPLVGNGDHGVPRLQYLWKF